MTAYEALTGERKTLNLFQVPDCLVAKALPHGYLKIIGNADALEEGLAIIGPRKIEHYRRQLAAMTAKIAAESGVRVITGGARGADTFAIKGALEGGLAPVVFLGGGIDKIYPQENANLFQEVIDAGGCIASAYDWDEDPLPYRFRERNHLIASLAKVTFVVAAAVPSGTYVTASIARELGREVWTFADEAHLIREGAKAIIGEDALTANLMRVFGKPAQSSSSNLAHTLRTCALSGECADNALDPIYTLQKYLGVHSGNDAESIRATLEELANAIEREHNEQYILRPRFGDGSFVQYGDEVEGLDGPVMGISATIGSNNEPYYELMDDCSSVESDGTFTRKTCLA